MPDVNLGKHRGVFVAIWRDEAGRRQRRSLGTTDRSLANKRLTSVKTQLAQEAPAGVLTVGSIFAGYVEDRAVEGKSTERIKYAWKRLGPAYSDLRPIDITKAVTRTTSPREVLMVSVLARSTPNWSTCVPRLLSPLNSDGSRKYPTSPSLRNQPPANITSHERRHSACSMPP